MKIELKPEQIAYPNGLEIAVEGFAVGKPRSTHHRRDSVTPGRTNANVRTPRGRSTPQVTTRNYLARDAPHRIELLGDKTRRPEPATHIIEFPGGAIELSRTSDGDYWAHIIVNRDFALPGDVEGLEGAYGVIVGSRIDYEHPAEPNIVEVPNQNRVRQIAILIKPTSKKIRFSLQPLPLKKTSSPFCRLPRSL